jgi:hypothetical protein
MPKTRNQTRYQHDEIDRCFAELLSRIQPEIIHVGHLNHLSTSIINVAAKMDIPIVYTLHNYWLMCPRGQFIQRNSEIPWQICDGQDDAKYAQKCFKGFFSGASEEADKDS